MLQLRAFMCGLIVLPLLAVGSSVVYAQSEVERLQNQIDDRNNRLLDIEKNGVFL